MICRSSSSSAIAAGEERKLTSNGIFLYEKDWHQAADLYKQWIGKYLLPPRVPGWVRDSNALIAHYDFRWQDGTYTHNFHDIPAICRRAAEGGVSHVLMVGWFTGGFDNMYPEFYPDLHLGTVMDFIDAVRTVRQAGGKPSFYINASLFGKTSSYHETLGAAWAVKDPQGRPVDRHFFDRDFTVNCRGVQGYRKHMRDTARWLVQEGGAAGVYVIEAPATEVSLLFVGSS